MNTHNDIAARFDHGVQERARWNTDAAEADFRALAEVDFARPRALTELAVTLSLQGRGAEALAAIAEAVALAPMDMTIRQNALILEKLREPADVAGFVAMHRQWGEDFAAGRGHLHAWRTRNPDPERRLRIAYIGVDAHTALKRFMPVLATHHDPAAFDVLFVYRSHTADEAAAANRRMPNVRHLHATGVNARSLAHTLAMLAIDIVIDLCGHGVGDALEALALRPAPVQMTWLDYVATTGVAAVDYRIADGVTDPEEAAWPEVGTETVLRLPFAQWSCTPLDTGTRTPRAAGAVVFGIVNATNKMSPLLLALAAKLLQSLPDSRLRVIGASGEHARAHLLALLPAVLHDRVDIIGRVDEAQFHRLLGEIDIALDPIVFSGATSTLDCLWAGIPVITLPGVLPHTRSTASILRTLVLGEWIARDEDDFVRIGLQLAGDSEARAHWRATLPERVSASTLGDGARFVPALERCYRDAWKKHLKTTEPIDAAALAGDANLLRQALVAAANAAAQLADPRRAILDLEPLALAMPGDSVQRNLSRAWNNLGVAWRRAHRADADAAFRNALAIWPQNPEASENLGDR